MCDRIACPPPPKRLRISELNPHLLCALCGGYLIDATTIIECLHSFCKTCILRYLETSTYCPICEVLIHKTRPWQNIRLDHSLQNAVYKMVPGLFQDEMRRRREFYEKQNLQDKRGRSRSQPQGEFGDRIIFSQDEEFSISIEFSPDGKPVKDVKENKGKSLKRTNGSCQPDKRYLKCPAGLRVEHLKKFIRSKFALPRSVEIDLFHEAEPLSETFSLMDVAYIYHWKRDCVLRLFYSFYEIPPKVRKVESVTHVTEKIPKNRLKGKSEGKSDKRDDDKKPKNKRERSKEKKQSKLSGKRKVTVEGSASITDSALVLAETAQVGSVKCKDIDITATPTVCSAEYMRCADTSSKVDRNMVNTLAVAKCSKKGHTTFQSPTKQKPPPESSTFSINSHSSNNVSNMVSKGHGSKTSIKLLIKSPDIKDCKSQNSEYLSTAIDVKNENKDMPSKVKIKKYQNGESNPISNANLFEKMSNLARSSDMEVKDLAVISDPYSSQFQNKACNNNTALGEAECLKCDTKSNVNIAKMSTTSKAEKFVDKKRMENKVAGEIVVNQDKQSQNFTMSLNKLEDAKLEKFSTNNSLVTTKNEKFSTNNSLVTTKNEKFSTNNSLVTTKNEKFSTNNSLVTTKNEKCCTNNSMVTTKNEKFSTNNNLVNTKNEKCNTNNSLENEMTSNPAGKERAVPDIKANKQETKFIIKSANQSNSDCKTEIHSVKSNGTQGVACNQGSKVTNNMQQDAQDSNGRTQDTNQNDIKLGQPEHRNGVANGKENGFKLPICDSTLTSVKSEPNSTTEDICNTRKICDSVSHTRAKLAMGDPKQMTAHSEKSIAKRALEDSKHNSIQNRDDGIPATSESKDHFDANMAALAKTSELPTVLQKIHNGLPKGTEIASVQSSVRMMQGQDASASKAVCETAGKDKLCSVNQQILIEPVSVSLQSENHLCTPSSHCSDIAVCVLKAVPSKNTLLVNSVTPKIRVSSSELNSAEIKTSSLKPAFVSGVSTTTTPSSPLPAPPKLMKTVVISTASSSSYLPTSYSIASTVSMPVFKPGSIPSASFTAASHALSISPAANVSVVSKSCDLTATIPHKAAAVLVACTTTLTKTVLSAPVTSSALVTTSASSVASGAMTPTSVLIERSIASDSPTPARHGNLSEATTSRSDASIKTIASTCAPSTASPGCVTTPTTAPSVVLPVTASPTASSLAPSSTVVTTLALTVTSTSISSWCTDTTVNVANTFLNMPPKESPALKNTHAKSSSRLSETSVSNMTLHKEAIKLDNFLFDTKPSERESLAAVSSHKVKDSCTLVKQIQKGPLRTKTTSSAQIHGLMNSKSVESAESQITAVHHLPKTVSHTSKPYSVAKSVSVSSAPATRCNSIIQTTKISTLIPKSTSISSKAGAFSKSFSYPSTLNSVPSSRSFLHTSLPPHMPRPDLSAVINGSSGYERALLAKTSGLTSASSSLHVASAATTSSSHHKASSKHSCKDGDNKAEKTQKGKAVPPLTIPKSCLTTLKLQRSPGSTDHYIFAPLSHYTAAAAAAHHNGERSKSKEVKYNGSRTPTSPPTPTKDSVFIGERQRVPTIKISDINRNPIIVESGGSSHGNSSNRHHSQFRSYSHGSSRSSSSDSGSARAHSRGGSDSNSPTGSSDRSDKSPARDARRPSDSELLLSHHWHGYSAADLLFSGFKLPTQSHPKFHDLHYDTDAMPLDYSQSSSKS